MSKLSENKEVLCTKCAASTDLQTVTVMRRVVDVPLYNLSMNGVQDIIDIVFDKLCNLGMFHIGDTEYHHVLMVVQGSDGELHTDTVTFQHYDTKEYMAVKDMLFAALIHDGRAKSTYALQFKSARDPEWSSASVWFDIQNTKPGFIHIVWSKFDRMLRSEYANYCAIKKATHCVL